MPDNQLVIGIDPGQSGAIAAISLYNHKVYALEKMPPTETDIYDLIYSLRHETVFAVIEKVHAMPKQGVSSTFKFGVGYGGLRMACIAAGIVLHEATPQVWQKLLGIPVRNVKKGETKNAHKTKMRAKAQQWFPTAKVVKDTADALLIAEYAFRIAKGVI
jgi:hypothetical protein